MAELDEVKSEVPEINEHEEKLAKRLFIMGK